MPQPCADQGPPARPQRVASLPARPQTARTWARPVLAGSAAVVLVGTGAAYALPPAAATWVQQAALAVPTLLGPFAAIQVRPRLRDLQLAQGCVGALLGSVALGLVGPAGYRAPVLDSLPTLVALALALQTSKRAWREGPARWPKKPLPWILRATLPVQLAAMGAYLAARTTAAAQATPARGATGVAAATALGPARSGFCVAVAGLVAAGMLVDGSRGRAKKVHAKNAASGLAFGLVGFVLLASGLQAGTYARAATRRAT